MTTYTGTFIYETSVVNDSINNYIINNNSSFTISSENITGEGPYTHNVVYSFNDNGTTNDGLAPKDSSIKITQFGSIPLSRGGEQFYNSSNDISFSGSVTASDNVTILSNTSLYKFMYNCKIGNSNYKFIIKMIVSNVINMSYTFYDSTFNQNINGWDVSNVTDMSYMFYNNRSFFNKNLSNWDVSNVTDMSYMFFGSKFNKTINNWDISNVTNMNNMFNSATHFTDILSNWDFSNKSTQNMFTNITSYVGYDIEQYLKEGFTITQLYDLGFSSSLILASHISQNLIYDILENNNELDLIENKVYKNYTLSTGGTKTITSFAINKNNDTMVCGLPFWFYPNSQQKGFVRIFKKINGIWYSKLTINTTHSSIHHYGYDVDISDDGSIIIFSDIGSQTSSVSSSGNTKGSIFTYKLTWNSETETLTGEKVYNTINGGTSDKRGRILRLSGNGTKMIVQSRKSVIIYWLDEINNVWTQKQSILNRINNNGYSVTMSKNGLMIAYGDPSPNKGSGKAYAFKYNSTSDSYVQIGGKMSDNMVYYGGIIRMSDDGNTIIIGTMDGLYDGTGVNIYKLNQTNNSWVRVFREIKGLSNDYGVVIGISDNGEYAGYIADDGRGYDHDIIILKYDNSKNTFNKIQTISNIADKDFGNGTRNIKFSSDNKYVYINSILNNLGVDHNTNNDKSVIHIYRIRELNGINTVNKILKENTSITDIDISDLLNNPNYSNYKLSKGKINTFKNLKNDDFFSSNNSYNGTNKPIINSVLTLDSSVSEIEVTTPSFITNGTKSAGGSRYMYLRINALDSNNNKLTYRNKSKKNGIYLEFSFADLDTSLPYYLLKCDSTTGEMLDPQPDGYPFTLQYNTSTTLWYTTLTSLSDVVVSSSSAPCFCKDVEILCYNPQTQTEYYKKIINIKENEDYVKTFGTPTKYSKVIVLQKKKFNNSNHIIPKKRLFRHKIHKDIILTGIHSMLYNNVSEDLYSKMKRHTKWSHNMMRVGDKIKVLSFMDPNFELYEDIQETFIYMIGVESNNDDASYGLYLKHGLFAETTSIKAFNKVIISK